MQAVRRKKETLYFADNVIDFAAYCPSVTEEKPQVDRVPILKGRRRPRQMALWADYCASGAIVLFVMAMLGKMMVLL